MDEYRKSVDARLAKGGVTDANAAAAQAQAWLNKVTTGKALTDDEMNRSGLPADARRPQALKFLGGVLDGAGRLLSLEHLEGAF